ncbi:P-type Ca2+ transporter type 2C [Marchantia polymorpha subsp. ruderalis]|uniref:Calcium-transporting ATPase n=2 Tax=Marchantia polymorpha TaxID=3197 RepID=A0A176W5D5_MARPO|nr:hypothetical protein AXG93_4492s1310 [Marchantia polymorpha subsp. ruderalis]PTQ38660.1 hypothetical protein MARPO_0050s0108 [Marchantia polymorpha]BBN05447.1 hypothetical protein Mp_3g13160 [Marchantia polymorpha subsp. ruderalis]|eukprot:PTQ38660.1 hypothetical protein MARPO_0050s0108 [Marchantia polymorpha]
MSKNSFSPLRAAPVDHHDGGMREEDEEEDDVFHIPPKPSLEMLKKWRKATLALNASRRFRYVLDLKNVEPVSSDPDKNGELVSRFRTVTHALRAVQRFKEAGARYTIKENMDPPPEGFGIGTDQLVHLMQDQQSSVLEEQGGVETVAKQLRTDLEHGIDDDPAGVEKRKEAFGSNKIPSKPGKHFFVFVWEACHDTTLIILMACAVVSFATGMWVDGPKEGWYDGISIGIAVLLVIIVTATSDYRQSLQFRSLNDVKKNIQIEAIRGGRRCRISVFDIVVGDLVPVNIGDQVPADGLMVSGQSLTIDESSMTGESLPVHKDSKHPFLLSGCKVVDGYGTMLVTAVGTHTEWGQVMATLTEDNGEETPLQVRLNGAATFIGQIGLSVAILVFCILFIRFFVADFKGRDKRPSRVIKHIVEIFSIAVTIVVVAVPEGLPLAVTLTLAYSMRKMMADKSLVRHLAACETMGSATTICSDKTGTLTLNKMNVVKSWVAGQNMENDEEVKTIKAETYNVLLAGVCQNSNGSVFDAKDGTAPEVSGSPTESAALSWGVKIGMDFDEIKHKTSIVHVETFNSRKKRAGVAVKLENGEIHAHWKGAAEMILESSSQWVDTDGSIKDMTPEKAKELENIIEGMAAASLRCIAFSYKPLDVKTVPKVEEELRDWQIPDSDLIFLAVIGIKDPCRPGVQEAVLRCQMAGVKVRMVTGDSVITAKAIATECGILSKEGVVVEGRDFRQWSKERMDRDLPKIDVMARSSPSDKLLLVKSLKERGEVVAVTGDGTNDAPALHEADVGLSMGISGTEVAKESSDIVILDDNFASIVKVVRWGRSVYANIQKFIQFQLTVNVTALVINFVTSVSSGSVPLTAVQLLWVNLIMDTLGALALATEPPTDDLMEKTPVGRKEPLITNIMWRNLFGQAFYQITVLLVLDFAGEGILNLNYTGVSRSNDEETKNDEVRKTIIFNAFVFCQIFNEVNARRPEKKNVFEGLHKNFLFIGIIIIEIIFQFVIVQYLTRFASTTALTAREWGICIAIGSVSWPLGFLVKFIPVPKKPIVNTRRIRINWKRKSRSLTKTLSSAMSRRSDDEISKSKKGSLNGELANQHRGTEVEMNAPATTPGAARVPEV